MFAFLLGAVFLLAGIVQPSMAQDEISAGYNKGVGLMTDGKWKEAQAVFDQLVKDWGEDATNTIGPAFCVTFAFTLASWSYKAPCRRCIPPFLPS